MKRAENSLNSNFWIVSIIESTHQAKMYALMIISCIIFLFCREPIAPPLLFLEFPIFVLFVAVPLLGEKARNQWEEEAE
jgi:hypothetical protein